MALRTVSVRVKDQPTVVVDSITYDKNISVKVSSQNSQRVSDVNYQISGKNYLKYLSDVDALSPEDKDTLIFNEITNKYESKQMTQNDVLITNLDAGLF